MTARSEPISILCLLAIVSAVIVGLLRSPWCFGFTFKFIATTAVVTSVMAMFAAVILPIRHDFIALAVGLPSAVIASIGTGTFIPLIFVPFFSVPYIGAAIGRDIRKVREKKTQGQPSPRD